MTGRAQRGVAIAAVLAVVALAVVLLHPWTRGDSTADQPTVWEAISDGIHDGEVPLETALQAFSYVHRLAIPGVELPDGVESTDGPTDGTGPWLWVMNHLDEMTAEQRAVVEAYLAPRPNDAVLHIGPDDVAPAPSLPDGPPRRPFAPAKAATLEESIKAELLADLVRIGGRLGLPVIRDSWALSDVELIIADQDGGNTQMETHTVTDPLLGHTAPCEVTVFRNMWSKEAAGAALSDTFHVVMTHEAVHCYQYAVALNMGADPGAYPVWISEGTAIWLAADDTRIAEPMVAGMWRRHILGRPERSLLDRSYDAYGLYALLAHLGHNMWGQMATAWRAALNAGAVSSPQAFLAPLGGDGQDVHDAWAPWHLREPGWNEPWVTTGFGLPADAVVPQRPAFARKAGSTDTVPDRANAIRSVVGSEAEIVRIETDGTASVHDPKGNNALSFTSRRFCVKGDCICPPGTDRAGERVVEGDLVIPFVLAVNGPAGGATYAITARTLEDECGTPPPTTVPPNATRCDQGCAMSNGDPHLVTVNGRSYDFQAAGEFVLLRSADGSLEVQTRQELHGQQHRVSINTAVAMRVDGHLIQIDSLDSNQRLQAHLDGVAVPSTSTAALGVHGKLVPYRDGFEVDTADGTTLWVSGMPTYGINVVVAPSDDVRAHSTGLIGTATAGGARMPALRDGSVAPDPPDAHAAYKFVYGTFADSWRLTDAETLFAYPEGRSTATYTQRGVPREEDLVPLDQLSAEDRAFGEASCGGVVDATLHAQCVFDAGLTHAAEYGDLYSATEAAVRGTAPTPVPAPDPAPAPVTTVRTTSEGTPTVLRLDAYRSVRGQALGDRLYLSVEDLDGSFRVLAVDPTTGSVTAEAEVMGGGTVVLAADSVWVDGAAGDGTCAIGRFDAATLAPQATIPTQFCSFSLDRSGLVSTGDAAWWVDGSTIAADGSGVTVRRIDPATNESLPGVPLPVGTEHVLGADGALFATAVTGAVSRSLGGGAFEQLGAHSGPMFPSGRGYWEVIGTTAAFFDDAGPASRSVEARDLVVAVGDDAIYAERNEDPDTLWRVPIDGSEPTLAATAPRVEAGVHLTYSDGPAMMVAGATIVKLWLVAIPGEDGLRVFMQTMGR